MPKEDVFLRDISVLYRRAQLYICGRLKQFGLVGEDHKMLLFICDHDGLSQDQIVFYTKLDKGTVARSMTRLEELGYIARHSDPSDKRKNAVYPTEEGFAVKAEILPVISDWIGSALVGFDETEKSLILDLCNRAAHNSCQSPEQCTGTNTIKGASSLSELE